jgi:hypothetical protein
MTKIIARKKPAVIDVVQLSWANWDDVCDFLGDIIGPHNPAFEIRPDEVSDTCREHGPAFIGLNIPTPQGKIRVMHGDYIIKEASGKLYSCKPDIFDDKYEILLAIP